jgi:prolyl-tRNA synthetase
LFLRTAEFLWQEGHTAHATKQEALVEAELMNNVYSKFAENFMAIPVIKGVKTESERFAGAVETYCIEALMQDGKALQAGTSHFLGQNFAKAFDVKFTTNEGKQEYVWATSWGVSTRLMGALIMTHSDDKGLVLPPNLAPSQVVIVPIYKTDEQLEIITEKANTIIQDLKAKGISCKFDSRTTHRPGAKFAQHELQGVPLRIAIGPKDLENGTIELARRDTLTKEIVEMSNLVSKVDGLLKTIQEELFTKALNFRDSHITEVDDFETFKKVLETKTGFISAHWDGSEETELKIKELTKATIRCIPSDAKNEDGKCVYSGKPSSRRVLFAKAY